ncbi:hypothetical protein A45J_1092 [hot springs metagenome]|uniref:Uncharacterized protein n=1 Tax=hot springs metagenome TaxID=433727 RepID=A0A5J4L0S4_9ZZZZ
MEFLYSDSPLNQVALKMGINSLYRNNPFLKFDGLSEL